MIRNSLTNRVSKLESDVFPSAATDFLRERIWAGRERVAGLRQDRVSKGHGHEDEVVTIRRERLVSLMRLHSSRRHGMI